MYGWIPLLLSLLMFGIASGFWLTIISHHIFFSHGFGLFTNLLLSYMYLLVSLKMLIALWPSLKNNLFAVWCYRKQKVDKFRFAIMLWYQFYALKSQLTLLYIEKIRCVCVCVGGGGGVIWDCFRFSYFCSKT